MSAITCESLTCLKSDWNNSGPGRVEDFSAVFECGEFIGFCGQDRSGKGLLLNVIGLLEKADSGRLVLLGHDAADFSEEDTATFRNEACGFLFGHPYLLPSFTVAENVAMPLFRICGGGAVEARERTREVLDFAGIGDFETARTGKLDPVLRWRAAFARALVHDPRVLIAISPPDPDLVPLAKLAADKFHLTVLWAGERETLAPCADRIIEMKNGRLLGP
ncbi:MAG: ATP-binding cassette domain-containing protein [Terrimicrobiaceae bacterium]|nr:ATP-binding cassette domain-containing protein [Terrimicrobiaceae bacterium]